MSDFRFELRTCTRCGREYIGQPNICAPCIGEAVKDWQRERAS